MGFDLDELHPDYLDFKLNWFKEAEDERDHKYKVQAPMEVPAVLPSKAMDILLHLPPVFNQGSLGSCTGNSTSAAIGFLRYKDPLLEDWVPARLLLYLLARIKEKTVKEDVGAQIRDVIKAAGETGTVPESEYPYIISKFADLPSDALLQSAAKHKTYDYFRVNWEDLNEVKGCLAAGFPIVFGFTVFKDFMSRRMEQTGIMEMPKDRKRNEGGHAVLAVGYDDSMGAILVRNSWGEKWGIHGNFWMPYDYVTDPTLSDDFWTIRATF